MTTTTPTQQSNQPTTSRDPIGPDQIGVLGQDEGRHLHFLNHLATVKVSPGASGAFSAVEFVAPRGFGPPLHSHQHEDELVIVLDGEVAFRSGESETIATSGATAHLPHGIPHTFQVLSETARILSITASANSTPNFDQFVTTLGEPLDAPTVPAPTPVDPGHVALVSAQHGIDVLGPPPAPLED